MASQPFSFQDIKSRLLALAPAEFQSLKEAYYYRWVTSLLRNNGWLNLLLGGLTLWLGLTGFGQSIFKVIQTIFGILIVGQSLWALRESTTSNIQRFSILFALCGIWNILLAVISGFYGIGLIIALLGILQLWSAYQFRKIHQQYSKVKLVKPSAEVAQLYDSIWKSLVKDIIYNDADYIEIEIQRRKWCGFPLPNRLVLAFKQRNILMLADKNDVLLVPINPRASGRWVEIIFKFDINASTVAKIPRSLYEKYVAWKGEAMVMADAPVELRQTRNIKRYIRIAALIILGLIALFVLNMISFMSRYV
jgi:hypothetical protein